MSNLMIMSQAKKLAENLSIDGDGKELVDTLKATAFKIKDGVVSDAQMAALLIVAQQYKLNPWTKQIYAYPDKQNGIVPVIGVDGWISIINSHPEYDGAEFAYSEDMVTPNGGKPCPTYIDCIIHRKDRTRPTIIREYLDEVYKQTQYASPWQTHTKRFLRHKALIQCARVAFGFSGIYDEDEAENIVNAGEKIINPLPPKAPEQTLQSVLAKIKAEPSDDFSWIDAKKFSPAEKMQIREATALRRKELREAAVVATIDAKTDVTDWADLVKNATSNEELTAIYNSMPPDIKAQFNDAVDEKMDSFRMPS